MARICMIMVSECSELCLHINSSKKAHALLKLTDGLLLLKHAAIADMFRKSILMNVHMFVKNEGSLLTETGMLQSTSEKKENVSS